MNAAPSARDGMFATSATSPNPPTTNVITPKTNANVVSGPVHRSMTSTRRPSSVTRSPPVSAMIRGSVGALMAGSLPLGIRSERHPRKHPVAQGEGVQQNRRDVRGYHGHQQVGEH